ncbi:MAG: hypothetical protein K0R66_1096 [Gammaproteobacteria bacterium]|jgi:hypothetical protein|nr:hypothetical protein [Gammaproteobacteria bacterium]
MFSVQNALKFLLLAYASIQSRAYNIINDQFFLAKPGEAARNPETAKLPFYDFALGPVYCEASMDFADPELSNFVTFYATGDCDPKRLILDLRPGGHELEFKGNGLTELNFVNNNGGAGKFANNLRVNCMQSEPDSANSANRMELFIIKPQQSTLENERARFDLGRGPVNCTVNMPSMDKAAAGTAEFYAVGAEAFPAAGEFNLRLGPSSISVELGDPRYGDRVSLVFANNNGKQPSTHSNNLFVSCYQG